MNVLNSLLHTLQPSEQKIDFISKLPPEMSQLILRKLDPESLLCAAQVSRSWMNVCRSDSYLKDTARQYKNKRKLELEKMKKCINASEDYQKRMESLTIKELNNYYNSCDYTQCANVYTIVQRVDEFLYKNHLDCIDEYSNLRF